MSVLESELKILPPLQNYLEVPLEFSTISYQYGKNLSEYGDREVIDVEENKIGRLKVPKINFLKWIETLISLKRNGVSFDHGYFKQLPPYNGEYVWEYFEEIEGNLLGYFHSKYPTRIYVYYISEFGYFGVIKLNSHKKLVSYSEN